MNVTIGLEERYKNEKEFGKNKPIRESSEEKMVYIKKEIESECNLFIKNLLKKQLYL